MLPKTVSYDEKVEWIRFVQTFHGDLSGTSVINTRHKGNNTFKKINNLIPYLLSLTTKNL